MESRWFHLMKNQFSVNQDEMWRPMNLQNKVDCDKFVAEMKTLGFDVKQYVFGKLHFLNCVELSCFHNSKPSTRWSSYINVFKVTVKVMYKIAYRCGKFNAYYLLRCPGNSALNFFLCWPTVTLYQDQGHQNEPEYKYVPCMSHANLNAIADIVSKILLLL